jgi:hypothetical protein
MISRNAHAGFPTAAKLDDCQTTRELLALRRHRDYPMIDTPLGQD